MARSSWMDEETQTPLIEDQARKMESFLQTLADGIVDEEEIKSQEARVVALMKEIEPQLSDELHEQVTKLLCELTAYDLMQVLHQMQMARPKATFQG
ncbi:Hypothetical protein PBC10988_31710 [Planctomycetales bacterium 10988]|nr:Hypothetical protein PBC10988_31710 [Planctomycetales bacterium 10988]